jgi:hypothetical protein
MELKENIVVLSTSSYNQIKSENTKFQMFISRVFESAELKSDYSGIEFDGHIIEELIRLCYPDAYKKKLSTLRTQQTKLSMKELQLNKPMEETQND